MNSKIAIALNGLLIVALSLAGGIVLSRIDDNRARVNELKTEIAKLRATIPPPKPVEPPNTFAAELQVCKSRTEWLRIVLETFVPLNDRVRLPDPPPGWQRWPAPNPNE